jgi:hypothetical protein
MKSYDVFLDSGVSVEVSDDVDPNTDEGYNTIKCLAKLKFIELLQHGFDIEIDESF